MNDFSIASDPVERREGGGPLMGVLDMLKYVFGGGVVVEYEWSSLLWCSPVSVHSVV